MVAHQLENRRALKLLAIVFSASLLALGCARSEPPTGPVISAQPTSTTAPPGSPAFGGALAVPTAEPPVTTPAGEVVGPVTTREVSGGDTSIYAGVLGTLDPSQQLVPPIDQPPENVAGVLPLTGLSGMAPERPAVVVKVDNVDSARPQTGLHMADIVYEEEVEAGFTRLAAVFHSQSSYVGPVRSGRTTDIAILNLFTSPVFIYSGANVATDSFLRALPNVQNHSFDTTSGFWRQPDRPSPSDLYTHTSPHWESSSGSAPRPQFYYRTEGQVVDGADVGTFQVSYRQNTANWQWDGAVWQRQQGGEAHVDVGGQQLSAANVLVVETERVDTAMVDGTGRVVPEFVFVGSGNAAIFTGGKRVEGTWTRPSLESVPTFTTASGERIELAAGQTWVEIVSSISQVS